MNETLWLYLDRFTIVIASISAVFSWWAWMRSTQLLKANRIAAQRKKAPITIQLQANVDGVQKSLVLPYKPRRDQLSRAEVMGILSVYYGKERFLPNMLRQVLESNSLSKVIEGSRDDSDCDEVLVIDVKPDVFEHIANELKIRK